MRIKDDGCIRWFGEGWGAPMNTATDRCPTPVGLRCLRCNLQIQEGDQGVMMVSIGFEDGDQAKATELAREWGLHFPRRPQHRDCLIRSIFPPHLWNFKTH